MLYAFDVDGTLVEGFLPNEPCPTCGGKGRVPDEPGAPACEPCKGKGVLWIKNAIDPTTGETVKSRKDMVERERAENYARTVLMPNRLERIREIVAAESDSARFALATNQGGIALGLQTEAEVGAKMGRVAAAMNYFCGRPWTLHMARCHPKAKLEGYDSPEELCLRKPLPGMIDQAMFWHYGYNPEWRDEPVGRSIRAMTTYIGDLASDRDAAEAAGVEFAWAHDFFA